MLMYQFYKTFRQYMNTGIPLDWNLRNNLHLRKNNIFPLIESIDLEPVTTQPFYTLFRPIGKNNKPSYKKYKDNFRIQKYLINTVFELTIPFDTLFCHLTKTTAIYIHKKENNYYGCFVYSRLTKNNRFVIHGIDTFCIEQDKKRYVLTLILPEVLNKTKPIPIKQRFTNTLQFLALFTNKCAALNAKKNNIYIKCQEQKRGFSCVNLNPTIVYTEVEDPNIVSHTQSNDSVNHCYGSWFRRGHWRKLQNIEKLGKDQLGNYVVPGYTWIRNTICGDGPLVNKPYILK